MEKTSLKLGFVALLDAAPLLVAGERGFFAEEGLTVELQRQPSWASVRDKLAVGSLDGAQMPAPMALAATLGLFGPIEPIITGLALNLGGNAITIASKFMTKLAAGQRPTLGIVHPFSAHHYEMLLWLDMVAVDDFELRVVPPVQMLPQLSAGLLDGYCVGEPWNRLAVQSGLGSIAITSREIWAERFEKVLGVQQSWAEQHPETHRALLRAVLRAAEWADQPEHRGELAELLSRPSHVNAPLPLLRTLLDDAVFFRGGANVPWPDQGLWYLAQMRRCGQLAGPVDGQAIVEQTFRTDLTRLAFNDLGLEEYSHEHDSQKARPSGDDRQWHGRDAHHRGAAGARPREI